MMTDFCRAPVFSARARSRSRSAKDRPATPRAPTFKKPRREQRLPTLLPPTVSMTLSLEGVVKSQRQVRTGVPDGGSAVIRPAVAGGPVYPDLVEWSQEPFLATTGDTKKRNFSGVVSGKGRCAAFDSLRALA